MEPATTAAPPWPIFAIVGGFLVAFPLFWCSIVWLISRLGGWHRMAERYAAGQRPVSGRLHRVGQAKIGLMGYRNVLRVQIADDGFFLGVLPLFAVGHPRLFIPWSAISKRTQRKVLWLDTEEIAIGRPVIATITLPARLLPEAPSLRTG